MSSITPKNIASVTHYKEETQKSETFRKALAELLFNSILAGTQTTHEWLKETQKLRALTYSAVFAAWESIVVDEKSIASDAQKEQTHAIVCSFFDMLLGQQVNAKRKKALLEFGSCLNKRVTLEMHRGVKGTTKGKAVAKFSGLISASGDLGDIVAPTTTPTSEDQKTTTQALGESQGQGQGQADAMQQMFLQMQQQMQEQMQQMFAQMQASNKKKGKA